MSRLTLYWSDLKRREGKDTILKIPLCEIYSPIIDRAFPYMDHIPWQSVEEQRCYTYIKDISDDEFDRLEAFLKKLEEIVLLTQSERLASHFGDELTECYALDYNYKQDILPRVYTEIGQAEHDAKWNRDSEAIRRLAEELSEVILKHPTFYRADLIAAVPPRPSKPFHLPTELVEQIGRITHKARLTELAKAEHHKLQDLSLADKLGELEGAFSLSEDIEGQAILLIDDLYQSGTTLWSLAKFLKSYGAREVYGLACVKSWSDTDNV